MRCLSLSIVLLVSSTAFGAWPLAHPFVPMRLDARGNPIPLGAAARYGDYAARYSRFYQVTFSPDGKLIARVRECGTDIRETATGKDVTPALVRGLHGSVEFTRDGHLLHTDGPFDKWVYRLLDREGMLIRDFSRHGQLHSLILNDDCSLAAIIRDDGEFLIDVASNSELVKVSDRFKDSNPLFTAGNRFLAYSLGGPQIAVYDIKAKKLLPFWKPNINLDGRVYHVVAGSTPDTLLVDTSTELITLRATPDGIKIANVLTPTLRGGFHVLVPAPDARSIFVQSFRSKLMQVELGSGKVLRQWPKGKANANRHDVMYFPSPDGQWICECDLTGAGRVSSWVTGKATFAYDGLRPVSGLQVGGDRVMAADAQVLRVYAFGSGKLLSEHQMTHEPGQRITAIAPDGTMCVVLRPGDKEAGEAIVREVISGRELWRTSSEYEGTRVAFTPDCSQIIIDRKVYAARTGRLLREYDFGRSSGRPLALSSDGRLMATSDGQKGLPIRVVETATAGIRHTLTAPGLEAGTGPFPYFQFSGDGRYLLGSNGYRLLIWSVADGRLLLDETASRGCGVPALSPDGRWLVQAGARHSRLLVRDWKAGTRAREILLPLAESGLWSLAFTPDGKYLLGGGEDGLVLVWETRSFPALARLFPSHSTLSESWSALASADATIAGKGVNDFIAQPREAVAFLRKKLLPGRSVTRVQIFALAAALGAEDFTIRQSATDMLAHLGEQAAPVLRVASRSSEPEVRERASRLLKKLDGPISDPRRLRALRAVEVAERIGTPTARELLAAWVGGTSEALLTCEAAAALERLSKAPVGN